MKAEIKSLVYGGTQKFKKLSGSGEPNNVMEYCIDGEGTMEGVLSDGFVSKEGSITVQGECWTACEIVCCSCLVFIVEFVANLVQEISEITVFFLVDE